MQELQEVIHQAHQVGAEKIACVNVQRLALRTNGEKRMETVKGNKK